MKNPYFDSTQGKIRLFNFSKYGSKYPIFQQLSQVPLQELNLNFFICVSRDLYKHIGEKFLSKEFIPRFLQYSLTISDSTTYT